MVFTLLLTIIAVILQHTNYMTKTTMKRLTLLVFLIAGIANSISAMKTPTSQMEKLDRGLIAFRPGISIFVSWRLLGTDNPNTTFDLLRNGEVIATELKVTNYSDAKGNLTSKYQVIAKVNGETVDTSKEVQPWSTKNLTLQLQRPADGKTKPYTTTINKETFSYPNGQDYSYTPNDMSVGDVDGDGQYELFVKWDPSNAKDNSQNGVTGNVYIDCYKLDGTFLWRIDLGKNIRAGAHYTQFMVYDFDGDGKAEMMCKTAPGSIDGTGKYVNQTATDNKITAASNTKDWVSEGSGRINGGQEYLTVFRGETGEAVHTIAYNPNRNAKSELSEVEGSFNWDDRSGKSDKGSYGNRGERYLAGVAYLEGADKNPCGIFCRGYYTYAYIWAVGFDGEHLIPKWLHRSDSKTKYSVITYDASGNGTTKSYTPAACKSGLGRNTMYGNGNHNMSIADVDGDGCDEIIWGSAALNNDGTLLYAVGFGHGDAIHLGDMDPDRPGLELYDVHEDKGRYPWDVHDAATGEIIWQGGQQGVDNGRGMAADIIASSRGYEFWSGYGGFGTNVNYVADSDDADKKPVKNGNPFNVQTGTAVGSKTPSMNFRIYWDGTCQDQLLDGGTENSKLPVITKVSASSISNVKAFAASDGTPRSCNSTKATPCLQADIFGDWREELIFWDGTDPSKIHIYTTNIKTDYRVPTLMHDHTYRMGICWQNTAYNQPPHLGYYLPDYVEGKIEIVDATGITTVKHNTSDKQKIYDLQGRLRNTLKPGLNIILEGGKSRKVLMK